MEAMRVAHICQKHYYMHWNPVNVDWWRIQFFRHRPSGLLEKELNPQAGVNCP
jgi:hypothetical protein